MLLPLQLRGLLLFAIGCVSLVAQPTALTVDTSSREEVRQFYRAVYFASENVPMSWTGSYATGAAGDTSASFKEATRLRINFFRALIGIPADIRFDAEYNTKAQQAALMMSANNALDHFPPPTWTFFTADGASAAGNSNLAVGNTGPDAVDAYIADSGPSNDVVGHRRWLFYPQTLRMGTGDVPGVLLDLQRPPANAIWVLQQPPGSPGSFGSTRPPTRTRETSYPPAGYIPYNLVWPRWSFSHPDGDFSAATVTMTRNGQPVTAVLERVSPNSGGEPTLVWVYDGQNTNSDAPHARPAADTTYTVNVRNVRLTTGGTRDFTYNVTVFDPDQTGPDSALDVVTGPASAVVGGSASYAVTKPTYTSAFEWRTIQTAPHTKTYTAEAGLDGLVVTSTSGYDVVQSDIAASGRSAYRLAHLNPRSDQILLLPGPYLASATSAVNFQSRLGITTPIQTARVQVSTDDGVSWLDIYSQAGTSLVDPPSSTESAFTPRSISLAAFAGRTVSVRFLFSVTPTGIAFGPGPNNNVGWYLDDISLANVNSVTASAATRVAVGNTFSFSPTLVGPVVLQVRSLIAGAYPLEWGRTLSINAIGDPANNTSYLFNLSVRTNASAGDALIIGFAISGGQKDLLARAVGPTLGAFGLSGTLADPKLDLFNSDSIRIGGNDNWNAADASTFDRVGAFQLNAGSRDASLVTGLNPGSYTAQISGADGGSGLTLVELYDTAAGNGTKLVNVSARTQVGTGDNILVAGFTIAGNGTRRLLIRAVGPTLAAFGVGGTLADPKLEIYSGSTRIAENDNWNAADGDTFASVGAFQLTRNSADAVLVLALQPGSYTAQISGANNSTGVALVEVYELP